MNIEARKISLIQEFLKIDNEDLINKLDKFLHDEKKKIYEEDLRPMPLDSFYSMIDQAEDDAANGRVIEVNDLKKEIEKWK